MKWSKSKFCYDMNTSRFMSEILIEDSNID
jgi:hypothetical protein